MNRLKKIHNKLINLKTINFIFLMVFLSYIITIPVLIFFDEISDSSENLTDLPLFYIILLIAIIVPIFETLFFQALIYKVCTRFSKNKWVYIIISSLLFGLLHPYNLQYMICGFLVGIVFAYAYIVYINKTSSPTFVVIVIHVLRNLFSVIIIQF